MTCEYGHICGLKAKLHSRKGSNPSAVGSYCNKGKLLCNEWVRKKASDYVNMELLFIYKRGVLL